MQSIIEELYHGNIRPDTMLYGPDTPLMKAVHVRNENMDKLAALLDEKQKEIFDAYMDAQGDIDSIIRYDKFTYGLTLGASLLMEIMLGREEMMK